MLDYALKQNYNKAIDNQRVQLLMGIYNKSGKSDKVQVPNIHERSMFSCERYKFFLDAPFEIGNYCCTIMKKNPSRDYAKRTGRKPITAQMASESRLRTQIWLKQGCNAFDSKKPISNPLSFWTEQDILEYIYIYNVPIASVYGEVVSDIPVEDKDALLEMWLFDKNRPTFSTTGMQRTGCMFCMYGIRNEKEPNRLQKMKETHPKIYDFIMKPESEGGLGYKEKIDWINEHGDMNVKY